MDEFMRLTYGDSLNVEIIDINGTTAYRYENPAKSFSHRIVFLETGGYRIEIYGTSAGAWRWNEVQAAVEAFELFEPIR